MLVRQLGNCRNFTSIFRPQLLIQVNDIILDPFMGSGTTAMVAKSLGRYYIGCELHEEYGKLMQKRIGEARGTLEHFI